MSTTIDNKLALDASSLDSLRLQTQQNPQQSLKAVAQQFEAVFLQMMLKSMRDATPQDGELDSDQTRMYTSMMDQQIAQSLSARGIGLADAMLQQLTRNQAAGMTTEAVTDATAGATIDSVVKTVTDEVTESVIAPLFNPVSAANALPATNTVQQTAGNAINKTPDAVATDFLSRMKEPALAASSATGIPVQFLLGHAALESGWGQREIRAADGTQSFNLFGVKAGASWKGKAVESMTTEYVDGVPRKVSQKFRAYGSYAEAFQDYASLMQGNSRYAAVLKQTSSTGFAQGLQQAGYATDPQYAQKLMGVLNSARLRQSLIA